MQRAARGLSARPGGARGEPRRRGAADGGVADAVALRAVASSEKVTFGPDECRAAAQRRGRARRSARSRRRRTRSTSTGRLPDPPPPLARLGGNQLSQAQICIGACSASASSPPSTPPPSAATTRRRTARSRCCARGGRGLVQHRRARARGGRPDPLRRRHVLRAGGDAAHRERHGGAPTSSATSATASRRWARAWRLRDGARRPRPPRRARAPLADAHRLEVSVAHGWALRSHAPPHLHAHAIIHRDVKLWNDALRRRRRRPPQ